jgi:serine/threonine protein kinase
VTSDDRWIEVSKSAYAHEAEGLELLRGIVPLATPYRVWTNFEFMDNHGGWNEVDALVLGRRRLHMVELKSYNGLLTGNEKNWILTGHNRQSRTQRSALLTTRHKAQKLASRLKEEARKVALNNGLNVDAVLRSLPFIQEEVFFHGDSFHADLSDLAKSNLYAIDGREDQTGLPGIAGRLLEPPSEGPRQYGEDMSVIVALALQELGATRRTERDAGSWTITGSTIGSGEDWQEFEVVHKLTGERGRGRIVTARRGAPPQTRAAAHRRIQREYTLIKSLRQESIVPPEDLTLDDDGNTVLIYPELSGYEPLDLAVETRALTADQQITTLAAVADALAYAHRNQVSNRGLSPSSVLINTERLDLEQKVEIRLADWSWAGRIHASTSASASSTMLGPQIPGTASDDDIYQAPEDRWSPSADRIAVDVFSLGALAYFLLAGESPARSRSELLQRLRSEGGLDLAASGGRFVDEQLRTLVLQATKPSVSDRVATGPKSGLPRFGAAQFRAALESYSAEHRPTAEPAPDPLNPLPGSELGDGRFEVVKVLGAGSTARGVLVRDHEDDHAQRVLKVGLDDSATARLYDEAEVLTRLGQQNPKIAGVVEILGPPLDLSGHTALLLSDCGEQTLSDLVRHMALSEAQLKTWGTELLDTVMSLDAIGIAHRDIKPANLGMAQAATKGKRAKTRLALFDFSLSRAGVTQIESGTPPYRDPFLGMGTRTAFDSAAERYSAAVVLYEMATASTPVYGDGLSDPRAINDDVAVDAEVFTDAGLSPTRAAALAEFFRTALARDARRRHDTAAAMREAWVAAFKTSATPTEDKQRPAGPTIAVEFDDHPRPAVPPYDSLPHLITDLKNAAGRKPTVMRRQVLELLLGTHENAPEDPFVTYADLGARVGVTPGRVAQIFGEFGGLLHSDDPVRAFTAQRLALTIGDLYQRAHTLLAASGGASTPNLLARDTMGDMQIGEVNDPQRAALGVLRLVLACGQQSEGTSADDAAHTSIEMVRRHGAGTVAMLATDAVDRRLPAMLARSAERLVAAAQQQGTTLVPAADAEPGLRKDAASVLGVETSEVEIGAHVLLAIAATASPEVGLTSRDELHASTLPVDAALRIVLQGLSKTDAFGRTELEDRLNARFPALRGALPRRPALDDLVAQVAPGMGWTETRARYQFPATSEPKGSTIPTFKTITAASPAGVESGSGLLRAIGSGERRFRALGVPLGHCDAVADALCARFGATRINVTDAILDAMRERAAAVGLDWNMILAADTGAATDREGLRGFVAQAVPAVVEAVAAVHGPVVLTDLSTLAAYGQLGIVSTWTDLTAPPLHSMWATLPQPHFSGGGGPLVDGVSLPINSPEQYIPLTEADMKVLVSEEAAVG